MDIEHLNSPTKGAFFIFESDQRLAEMVYTWAGDDKFIIEHTMVSDELKGQGIGRQLLDRAVAFAREKNLKIMPLCPFAKSVFDKDSSIRDVLY
jgi:uncharacterized protein